MRIALCSDIHANYCALTKVSEFGRKLGVEQWWCLGDVVGYGPHPVESVEWLLENVKEEHWVPGNHEARLFEYTDSLMMGQGKVDGDPIVMQTLEIHRHCLRNTSFGKENLLIRLEKRCGPVRHQPRIVTYGEPALVLTHDSLIERFRYVRPWTPAYPEFELEELAGYASSHHRSTAVALMGHTHVPMLVQGHVDEDRNVCVKRETVQYRKRYLLSSPLALINPGSVGQPRDHSPCASFAVLDLEDSGTAAITFYKVAYEVDHTIADLARGGYPSECWQWLDDPSSKVSGEITPDWDTHLREASRDCMDATDCWEASEGDDT